MNMIRPVSDLRNNFADISKTVHETAQPVFLTKNGYGAIRERGIFQVAGGRERGRADGSALFLQRGAESDEGRYWRGTGCIN